MPTTTNPRRRSRDSHPLNSVPTAGLLKSATFHSPTWATCAALPSPPASPSLTDRFVPPILGRSHSDPDDVIDAHRRRAALLVSDIDRFFNNNGTKEILPPRPTTSPLDDVLPIPRSFLGFDIADRKAEGQRPRPPHQPTKPKHDHASDSGLGSSIASTKRLQVSETPPSAITRSAASATMHRLPGVSKKAVNRIQEHLLKPLHSKPSLKDFVPILLDVPRRIRAKDILCLRDLEKDLLFKAPETTKSSSLYLDFCLTSVRCVQATVEYLNEHEQVRPGDRPYTNGYFVDLKEQIFQYASQLAAPKDEEKDAKKAERVDIFDLDPTDEVRLYGGLGKNGRPAELIRVNKDGRAFSIASGEEVDLSSDGKEIPYIRMKRSLSTEPEDEDEEEIMRSMARRKKNAPPEQLIPHICFHEHCGKKFTRVCDLRKHTKTHIRLWKCETESCRYSSLGWPTKKELDRHFNDKHSSNPAMYSCNFAPCPYKSKRESNCKQHMEKAHGWVYVRQKTNGKKSNPGSVCDQSLSPVSNHPHGAPTPPGDEYRYSHYNQFEYPTYPADQEHMQAPGQMPMTLDETDLEMPRQARSQYEAFGDAFQTGSSFVVRDELYATPVHVATPTPHLFDLSKVQRIQVPPLNAPPSCVAPHSQSAAPFTPPHRASFSPHAESNAMLFTPTSMEGDEHERYDEHYDNSYKREQMPSDFQLFPMDVKTLQSNVFHQVPSPMVSYSQVSAQQMFPSLTTQLPLDQSLWDSSAQRPPQQTSSFQQTQFHPLYC